MSTVTSESGGVTRAERIENRHLDSDFAALNINSGTGTQSNYHQTGVQNTQYNAHTQTFYNTARPLTEQEKIIECQNALLTISPEDHRAGIISAKGKRVTGTCEWIKKNEEYQSLLHGETQMLWIQGGPGKGKTMLSIFLTQELQRGQSVIYFFCQADDETRRSATYVLRSMIWQLAVQEPATALHLSQYFHPPKDKSHVLGSREALWNIFVRMAEDSKTTRTYLMLDGLDECDEDSQRWLVLKLEDLCHASERLTGISNLRIIVVSRPGISMSRGVTRVVLDSDNSELVNHDISAFISSKVQVLSKQLEDLPGDSRAEFESRMQAEFRHRAEGTFLWIGFAMIELLKKRTRTQMEDVMRELPKGLDALYDRMLIQIDSRYHSTASKILRWVAFAARPLSIYEIGDIIGSKPSESLSAEQITLDHLTISESFITISKHIVSLVHESAREYISLPRDHQSAVLGNFFLQPCDTHLEMATFCLAYIEKHYGTQGKFDQDVVEENNTEESSTHDSMSPTPLRSISRYAALYWPEHARCSGDSFEQLVAAAPMFFAKRSCLRDTWWTNVFAPSLTWTRKIYDIFGFNDPPALHMACFLGIAPWVNKLLRPKMRFLPRHPQNRPHGRYYMTPLMYATIGGHAGIVDHLLRNHAKIDSKNLRRETALHHAVQYERVDVMQLLLTRGADPDAQNICEDSVFHVAAEFGNVMLMQQLLDHPRSLESRLSGCRREPGYANTPLHIATVDGDVDMMECLLSRGAGIDSKFFSQETPLYVAAFWGHVKGLRLLLQRGASVDSRCDTGGTPLHGAAMSERPSEVIFECLLAAGADVNARSYHDETPLYTAVSSNRTSEAMICVLLQAGADIGARTATGATPLHAAAGTEGLGRGILERLILEGAEVDSLSDDGHSPLDLALKIGFNARTNQRDLSNACVLIAHGARVNLADRVTLLHKAAFTGDEQLVKVLLDHGFRSMVSVLDDAGATPLQWAIIGSETMRHVKDDLNLGSTDLEFFHEEHLASAARLIIESHTSIGAADWEEVMRLHYAKRKEILRVLLASGADVSVKAKNGKTALQMAIAARNRELVQPLVEHGAQYVD